ncbi:MAG: D-alanyl-D-alanine carboxypeptidase/D-alanyl-D-alanine-endopeptidase [Bacteroidia bacterium]|nr:D-alanyl-D-alanine carboxypeptidase/D-alanyl-D-alanine-endopeptidase [Bacteroidia bacterium]
MLRKHFSWVAGAALGAALTLLLLVFFGVFRKGETPTKKFIKGVRDAVKTPGNEMPRTAFQQLKYALDSIRNSPAMRYGAFGFCLFDPDSGKVILENDANRSLVPASVLKVLTTGVALSRLGSGFRFATRLQYDGKIESGILNGNIYIQGTGDPSLGSEVFGSSSDKVMSAFVAAIKKQGIDSITGRIIADAELFEFDPIPLGYAWEDIQNDYGTGVCGLNFCENWFEIDVKVQNKTTYIKSRQDVPGLILLNQVFYNPKIHKSYVYVHSGPYNPERVAMGEVANDFMARAPIPDAPLYCAYTLKNSLKSAGIRVKDTVQTIRKLKVNGMYEKRERKTFYSMVSPSLSQLVFHTNQISQNFYAESILRGLGLQRHDFGSTLNGVSSVMAYAKEHKVDLGGFYMTDGSGVSRFNGITCKQLTLMLNAYTRDTAMFGVFYNSLPTAGETGTLRRIGEGTSADGKIRAKSGYMTRVRSYAGYVTTKSGRRLSFSMISNNHQLDAIGIRNVMERLMILMAELE